MTKYALVENNEIVEVFYDKHEALAGYDYAIRYEHEKSVVIELIEFKTLCEHEGLTRI